MRHTGFDVDKVARLVDDCLLRILAKGVLGFTLQDKQLHLEALMDMGIGNASRGYRGHVDGKAGRAHVFSGHALQALLAAAFAPAADHADAAVVFHRAQIGLGDLCHAVFYPGPETH